MAITLYESGAERRPEEEAPTVVVIGSVTNNVDLVGEGRVLVRIASIDDEVWARLTAIGAGPGAGFLYVPRIEDRVVVALSGNDAFVLGGLWSTLDRPPVDVPSVEAMTKRVI